MEVTFSRLTVIIVVESAAIRMAVRIACKVVPNGIEVGRRAEEERDASHRLVVSTYLGMGNGRAVTKSLGRSGRVPGHFSESGDGRVEKENGKRIIKTIICDWERRTDFDPVNKEDSSAQGIGIVEAI